MSHQPHQTITTELRDWIEAQHQAGLDAEQVLQAMLRSGWDAAVAAQALAQVTAGTLPPAVAVPEPDLGTGRSRLRAVDRDVDVLLSLRHPRVVVFGGLLSEAECDALRADASARLARSETVAAADDGSEVNAARTSEGMFFERGETALIQRIEARIAALLNWPVLNGEGLQVLRYRPGAEYLPHFDYFDSRHASTPAILKRGGQRVATLVIYLNTPQRGGATTFPDAGLEVLPVKGNAVFFNYERPHPSTLTLHGGAPVLDGEKWVATKWLRQGKFD